MTTAVLFKMTKPDSAQATVELIDGDNTGERIRLEFDDEGNASARVNGAEDYTASWELTGAIGDRIVVTWATVNDRGTMITGKISEANSEQLNNGRRRTERMGFLPPVGD